MLADQLIRQLRPGGNPSRALTGFTRFHPLLANLTGAKLRGRQKEFLLARRRGGCRGGRGQTQGLLVRRL